MIQEISPHIYHPEYIHEKTPKSGDFALFYQNNQVLLKSTGISDFPFEIPLFSELVSEQPQIAQDLEYLLSIDKSSYFLIKNVTCLENSPFQMQPFTIFRTLAPQFQAFAGITGSQIFRFYESRKFCGKCGAPTRHSLTERATICIQCGQIEYPKISPAIIVAITNGSRLLMTRYRKGNYKHYALVAGFVEIGETFEDTVKREVMEEVGLKVKNIRLYKNQPWAFSDTAMIGFFAELDGSDTITLEENELKEAAWFERQDIPLPPMDISIGHEMIRKFKAGEL